MTKVTEPVVNPQEYEASLKVKAFNDGRAYDLLVDTIFSACSEVLKDPRAYQGKSIQRMHLGIRKHLINLQRLETSYFGYPLSLTSPGEFEGIPPESHRHPAYPARIAREAIRSLDVRLQEENLSVLPIETDIHSV